MKKIIAMLIILTLCLNLCACGAGAQQSDGASVQNKPVNSVKTQNAVSGEAVKSTEAAEETYPWEAEFREEDYYRLEGAAAPNGDKATTWLKGELLDKTVRQLYEWGSGDTMDSYYYPSGNISHSYFWHTDGTYEEVHYLDNEKADSEQESTRIYFKQVNPDDSWFEYHYNENEVLTFLASMEANGTYSESYFFENGNVKKFVSINPPSEYTEQECYETGRIKYNKSESAEYVMEERYDEKGYRTYYCQKSSEYELELTADETGKLVKVVETGEVKEDEETLAWYASSYNFRG